MSEPTPPPAAAEAAGSAAPVLTAQAIDGVLAEFRGWLEELAAGPSGDPPPPAAGPAVDLHTLLGQFVALRHEVHLQTRAVRTQQEQNAETLRQLTDALAALQAAAPAATDSAGELLPLLKTLMEMHDALTLAGRELQRLGDQLLPALPTWLPNGQPAALPPPAAPSWWSRLRGIEQVRTVVREEIDRVARPDAAAAQRTRLEQHVAAARQLLAAVVAGFGMTLQRVGRALEQHGLEPLAAVGQPFDAETMEAVEVTPDSDRPDGEVLEEVRRGYRWRGRVFRFAQVRVARGGREPGA